MLVFVGSMPVCRGEPSARRSFLQSFGQFHLPLPPKLKNKEEEEEEEKANKLVLFTGRSRCSRTSHCSTRWESWRRKARDQERSASWVPAHSEPNTEVPRKEIPLVTDVGVPCESALEYAVSA